MTDRSTTAPGQPIVVVGAGPAGLVTALAIARRGLSVVVLERESGVYRAPRAMGYHWSSLFILEDLGLLDDMIGRGFVTNGIKFHVPSTGEVLMFPLAPLVGRVKHAYGLTLGQGEFAQTAVDHLETMSNVEIRWNTEVADILQTEDEVVVTLADGEQLRTPWLVGADGASSRVRGTVGLGFGGLTWSDNFIATDVRFDFAEHGYADNNYVIDPVYGSVLARLTNDGAWRVTLSESAELPLDGLEARIHTFLKAFLPAGADYELLDHTRYRMHQRAAASMRVGRVVLVGDAAHATNPTSGFGLVGGMFDGIVLAEALEAIERNEVGAEVLDRYSEDRIGAFWTVSSPLSVDSKRLVFDSDDPDRLEIDMKMFRRIAQSERGLTEFWLRGSRVESPSVVTGRLLSDGRNQLGPAPA